MVTYVYQYTAVIQKKIEYTDTASNIDHSAIPKAAFVLRAISHQVRKDIIALLGKRTRMQVTEIYTELGLLQAVASQHLAILRKAKIVKVQYNDQDCRVIYYYLNHDRMTEIAAFAKGVAIEKGVLQHSHDYS